MKSIAAILASLLSFAGFAQQDPYFVTDGFGAMWNNPASHGAKNKFSASTVGRIQWVGLVGAPKSFLLNSEYGVNLDKGKTKNLKGKLGIGINLIAEQFGSANEQIFHAPINYHFKIEETYLSVGLGIGFRRLDFSDFWIPPQTQEDSLLPDYKQAAFELNAGVFWYGKNFYLGISSTQLTAPTYDNFNYQAARHYHLQAGYRFGLGEHYLYPQLQLRSDAATFNFQSMNYFQFKEDIFSIGAGFGAGHVLMGASFRYKFAKLSYNFGIDLSPLSNYTRNSHEVRLTFVWN